jgi:hypothetical protein
MSTRLLERALTRGSAELLVLALLEKQRRHGYEIGGLIERCSGDASQRSVFDSFFTALDRVAGVRPV